MTGNEWSRIFADTIGGEEYPRPLGVADVAWNGCCWSVKTVKQNSPHRVKRVRLISGRNSPHFSAGISDPRADIQATGHAVLQIYNQRIEEARSEHDDVRLVILVRNMTSQQFTIFERDLSRVEIRNYAWRVNARGNLEAFDGESHAFTWQPHGSQFTIVEPVPERAIRFRIRRQPPIVTMEQILRLTRFESDWVEILLNR